MAQPTPHNAVPSSPGPVPARAPGHAPGSSHIDPNSYYNKFNEISQNIAYRYPDPGPPR